jgi:hypothetical protein
MSSPTAAYDKQRTRRRFAKSETWSMFRFTETTWLGHGNHRLSLSGPNAKEWREQTLGAMTIIYPNFSLAQVPQTSWCPEHDTLLLAITTETWQSDRRARTPVPPVRPRVHTHHSHFETRRDWRGGGPWVVVILWTQRHPGLDARLSHTDSAWRYGRPAVFW